MAAKITLDRSRHFATVHGEDVTHAFEQDGLPFDHRGELALALVPKEKRAAVDKKLKRLERQAPTDGSDAAPPSPETEDDGEPDGSDINFDAWLQDKVKYQPHVLYAEARKRYSKNFTSTRDLAEFLVFEEKICSPDEVPTKLGPRES